MTTSDTRYRVNEEEVAAKVMDGEAIIINLSSGVYYSTDQVGALVWELVAAGHAPSEVAAAVAARYAVAPEVALADTTDMVNLLLREELVLPAAGREPPAAVAAESATAATYSKPALNIYKDMGDLLALDPPMPSLSDVPWKHE